MYAKDDKSHFWKDAHALVAQDETCIDQNFPTQTKQNIPYSDYFQWKYIHNFLLYKIVFEINVIPTSIL